MTKIVFLDRDGVINRFPGIGRYVTKQKDFRFIRGSLNAIAALTKAGHELNVISNQGCVSRGLISQKSLDRMTALMLRDIKKEGGEVRSVYYCLHQTSDQCNCKKPSIALLKKAIGRRKIRFSGTFYIGDSAEDMLAAKRAGCTAILVLSGRVKRGDIKDLPAKPDVVKKNLGEAAQWILKRRS